MRRFIPKLNRVVRTLIFYDFIVYAGWGLVSPVFAVYILDEIKGGTIFVVGIAISIYWTSKALMQIPIGKYLDQKQARQTNLNFLMMGTAIMSTIPLFYIFADQIWHILILQFVHAIGVSMAVPAWGGVFMTHVEKGRESESWSAESSILGLGLGAAGFIGGFVISNYGYTPIFIAISILGTLGVYAMHSLKYEEGTSPHRQFLRVASAPIKKTNRYLR
ncbi:MAG: MFS transporter [Candidatus Spechtbacterales bacterium]|nr:MFS transporter [Candidatus Spechtbacterales bacterium]